MSETVQPTISLIERNAPQNDGLSSIVKTARDDLSAAFALYSSSPDLADQSIADITNHFVEGATKPTTLEERKVALVEAIGEFGATLPEETIDAIARGDESSTLDLLDDPIRFILEQDPNLTPFQIEELNQVQQDLIDIGLMQNLADTVNLLLRNGGGKSSSSSRPGIRKVSSSSTPGPVIPGGPGGGRPQKNRLSKVAKSIASIPISIFNSIKNLPNKSVFNRRTGLTVIILGGLLTAAVYLAGKKDGTFSFENITAKSIGQRAVAKSGEKLNEELEQTQQETIEEQVATFNSQIVDFATNSLPPDANSDAIQQTASLAATTLGGGRIFTNEKVRAVDDQGNLTDEKVDILTFTQEWDPRNSMPSVVLNGIINQTQNQDILNIPSTGMINMYGQVRDTQPGLWQSMLDLEMTVQVSTDPEHPELMTTFDGAEILTRLINITNALEPYYTFEFGADATKFSGEGIAFTATTPEEKQKLANLMEQYSKALLDLRWYNFGVRNETSQAGGEVAQSMIEKRYIIGYDNSGNPISVNDQELTT